MTQKKNYWTYCKDCDTYHTCEDINKKWHDPDIPQLPALPEDERGPPLWTPDMKGTAEGNLMEWVLAMQLEKQKRKRKSDGRIDWGIMKHISEVNLEDWV
jgi:hypothetical protein